jgi:hypothetical protein
MARYIVKCSCGHEGMFELTGDMDDRKRKREWYGRYGLCPECYRERKACEPMRVAVTAVDGVHTVVFRGETYSRRGELKRLGARWDGVEWSVAAPVDLEDDAATRATLDLLVRIAALENTINEDGRVEQGILHLSGIFAAGG